MTGYTGTQTFYLKDDYHISKQRLYRKNGYDSLFFRSDEILNSPEIVRSILLNRLGISKPIYARKCQIKEVSTKESTEFLQNNHLMGKGAGFSIGLYHEEELVFLGRFRRTKDNNWDISRMCPKIGLSVVGGYSRVLKRFEREKSPDLLSNFIDMRYGSGEYLTAFGFVKTSLFPSFKWTNGRETFHRMRFRGNSGYEQNLVKIWDCGQKKMVKKYQ